MVLRGGASSVGSSFGGQIDLVGGGAAADPGAVRFRTGTGAGAEQAERMRIDSAGDITIAGGGAIKADFSNATVANRTYFQTSTVSGITIVGVIPNGAATATAFYAFNNSTPTNSSICGVVVESARAVLNSAAVGTGTYLPLVIQTNNQEQARFTTTDRYFRMAASTGGIQFKGDTAAANALNDYEEGTFTPTVNGSSTAGTATYSQQLGTYTKIGRQVTVCARVVYTAGTGVGTLRIAGMPFASANVTNRYFFGNTTASDLTITVSDVILCNTVPNGSYVDIGFYDNSGTTLNTVPLPYDAAATINVQITYFTS